MDFHFKIIYYNGLSWQKESISGTKIMDYNRFEWVIMDYIRSKIIDYNGYIIDFVV